MANQQLNQKKVMFLITGLGLGGAEMMLYKTLPILKRTFSISVCSMMTRGVIGEKLEKEGIKVNILDLKDIKSIIPAILKFKKVIKEEKPDLLITYLIHADLFGRIFGKMFGIKKVICSQRGSLLQWDFLRFFDRLTKFLVDKYIVQTQSAGTELEKKIKIKKNKYSIIPNAIKIVDFVPYKIKKIKKLQVRPNTINIISVCNLRPQKGLEYLLEAFENVYIIYPHVNLIIVGDGTEKQRLINQVKNYKSKKYIYFLGRRTDIKELLNFSDIFVLPTLAEGMSNAILEAMALSLPVITTNIGVNQDIITNGKNGILVEPKSSSQLSQAIYTLIKRPLLRKKVGNNARKEIINKYEISIIITKTIILINSII